MHGRRARINNSLFETLRAKEAGLRLTIVDDDPHCGSGLCLQTSATEFFKRHAVFQCVLRSPSRLGSGQVQPPALRVGSGWRTSELQGELLRR